MQLIVDHLAITRGGEPVLQGISFAVAAGETLLVTGPNGVGKSTLLRVIAGLLPAEQGAVRLSGAGLAGHRREHMHYLGHRNAMKPTLTARENLSFWKAFMDADGDRTGPGGAAMTVMEAAEAVGLSAIADLPFGYLSAGQQRRLAMAKLLVAHRPVWLLDEPTAALDAASEAIFAGLVSAHVGAGGIVVAATHQPLGIEAARKLALAPSAATFASPAGRA